jgi:hypothetical protein
MKVRYTEYVLAPYMSVFSITENSGEIRCPSANTRTDGLLQKSKICKTKVEWREKMIDPYTRADPSPMTEVVMYQALGIRRPMTKIIKPKKKARVLGNELAGKKYPGPGFVISHRQACRSRPIFILLVKSSGKARGTTSGMLSRSIMRSTIYIQTCCGVHVGGVLTDRPRRAIKATHLRWCIPLPPASPRQCERKPDQLD